MESMANSNKKEKIEKEEFSMKQGNSQLIAVSRQSVRELTKSMSLALEAMK